MATKLDIPHGPLPFDHPVSAGWRQIDRWLSAHRSWVLPWWLAETAVSGGHASVTLHADSDDTAEAWAEGVARVWEDGSGTRLVTIGKAGGESGGPFLALYWRSDDVRVAVFSPRRPTLGDLEPYRAALVDAGVLRAEPVDVDAEVAP